MGKLGLGIGVAAAVALATTPAADAKTRGLELLAKGNCATAVDEFLMARSLGDSSNPLLFNLSQALVCANRPVDALSATFAGSLTDTAGKLDLLLFRAQLLRRMGLEDDAAALEKELGDAAVAGANLLGNDDSRGQWAGGLTGSVGWAYNQDVLTAADSLGTLEAWFASNRSNQVTGETSETSNALDSIHVRGGYIPLGTSAWAGYYWGRYYLMASGSGQVGIKTDASDWVSASGNLSLLAGADWTLGRFKFDVTALGYRNLNGSPTQDWFQTGGYSLSQETKAAVGSFGLAQANSVSLYTDFAEVHYLTEGLHSVRASYPLPWALTAAGAGSYAWSVRNVKSSLERWEAQVLEVHVTGARLGIENHDPALRFLDTAGVVMAKPTNPFDHSYEKVFAGGGAGQSVDTLDGIDYPVSSSLNWVRWAGSVSLSKPFYKWLSSSLSLGISRTEWTHDQAVTPGYPDDLESGHAGQILFYQDVATGERYWVGASSGSRLLPVALSLHRVDWATSVQASTRVVLGKYAKLDAVWTWIGNRSNLERFVTGSSYTRMVWNTTASFEW